MSPHHQGFIRKLRTTTALLSSAGFLVSENVRRIREQQEERYYVPIHPSMEKEIQGAILLSEVKPIIERMH